MQRKDKFCFCKNRHKNPKPTCISGLFVLILKFLYDQDKDQFENELVPVATDDLAWEIADKLWKYAETGKGKFLPSDEEWWAIVGRRHYVLDHLYIPRAALPELAKYPYPAWDFVPISPDNNRQVKSFPVDEFDDEDQPFTALARRIRDE